MNPEISVISAVQEHHCFENWMLSLANQTLPRSKFEVIVTDGTGTRDWSNSAEKVLAEAGEDFDFKFVPMQKCGRAAATNHAISLSSAPILLFIADDFVPKPDVVALHLEFHQKNSTPTSGATGPGVFDSNNTTPFMQWMEESGTLFGVSFTDENKTLPSGFWYLGNSSLKRSFLLQRGPFDERFPYDAWDDYDMSRRLYESGMELTYLPNAVCVHEHHISLHERYRAMHRAGESAVIFESNYNQAQPWHALTDRSNELLSWKGWGEIAKLWLQQALKQSPDDRDAFYRRILDQAFVAGYRSGIKNKQQLNPVTS